MGYISVLFFACYVGMVFLAASKIEALEKEGKEQPLCNNCFFFKLLFYLLY